MIPTLLYQGHQSNNMDHVGKVCMPGDVINDIKESEATKKAFLGPGLRQDGETVVVCKPGIFKFREPNVYWIDSHEKKVRIRYTTAV